jgi:hypothetical protein
MSALPPKADIVEQDRDVRFVHKRTHAVKQKKVAAPTQQLAELSRDDDVGTGGVDANEASCH